MSGLLQQVRADSPAAYWVAGGSTLTELLKDRSGNGRDLTDAGGGVAPAASTPSLTPAGAAASALDWGSATNNLYVADAAWNSLTSALTLEGWFRFTSVSAQQGLLEKYDPGGGYLLRLTSSGFVSAGPLNSGGSFDALLSAAALSTLRTYHVAYTLSGTTGILYIDGVQSSTKTHSNGADDGSARLDIGARSGDQTFRFSGRMGHVALYPSALSATRIAAHYAAGRRSGVSY